MSGLLRALAAAGGLLAAAPAARAAQHAAPAEPALVAPASIRGALVLEPSRLALGDVATLDLAVVTPPGYGVRPAGPSPMTPGFWLLSSEARPPEREPGRWIHRTRLRVRAREVGRFAWPAWPMIVEAPDGATFALAIEGREIEVRSILPELAGRSVPFGLRDAPSERRGGDPLGPALAGALVTLALVGLVALVRRERRRRAEAERASALARAPADAAPWDDARRALDAAAGEPDPNAVADVVAAALRRYLERRFGVAAEAFATEELAAGATPFAVRSRWPRYLALLGELDALRFPPGPADAAARASAALAAARALVADSTPRDDERPPRQASRT